MNILFTSAGRRVSLLRSFRNVLTELNIEGKIFSADAGLSAPASFVSDKNFKVPRVDSEDYIPILVNICKDNDVKLLVSLIDTDLSLLSEHKEFFKSFGTTVLVCDKATNDICFDKKSTYDFFKTSNIKTAEIVDESQIQSLRDDDFPLMVKPWDGSCSVGVNVAKDMEQLRFYKTHTNNAIIQRLLIGEEYTCDAYVDFNGEVRCVVPRKRLETRAGEVSKGLTVRDPDIINSVIDCVNKLPHAVGCMTVQCFKLDESGEIAFIEINPRFGGGHPLSIHAGANFPKWIVQELLYGTCDAGFDNWIDDLAMLRFDDEIIVPGERIR